MKIGIVGTGHTKFGRLEQSIDEIMFNVCVEVLKNAKTTIDDVDIIYIANFSSSFSNQCHLPAVLASKLGVKKEIVRIESACASGGVALKEAAIAILSGMYRTALVIGVEKMTDASIDKTTALLASAASQEEVKHGATFPSLYALMARSHFYEYGTTEKHLALISVKNHKHAMLNPNAQFHKEITFEDVLNSRIIASPLKLFDCAPISDGAAAVLLCKSENVSQFSDKAVYLIGFGHSTDSIELYNREKLTTMPAVINAAKQAYRMAGMEPKDIDCAELHDCFTIAELMQMEDLGFCRTGEATKMLEEGQTELNGSLPINTSGGLKAKGHPIGATGLSQIVEVVNQINGSCGERQVKNAKIGLCCNIGGSGSSAVVSIFSK